MMKKISKCLGGLSAVALALLVGVSANAQVESATSTLDSIMSTIISTTVGLATTIFTTYWPYVLVFGIIAGLVGVFARFLKIGGKK
jgi:hypothetical protein